MIIIRLYLENKRVRYKPVLDAIYHVISCVSRCLPNHELFYETYERLLFQTIHVISTHVLKVMLR